MDIHAIHKLLHGELGSSVGPVEQGTASSWIEVDPDRIDAVGTFLRDDERLRFDCLWNLSGCDYPEGNKIQIVYHLYSYEFDHELTLKVDAAREAPVVNTAEQVWSAANWLEREVYDLLGVDFPGHPDLRRILLPDDWVGSPLRKDYVEAPDYHGISTVRESIMNIPNRH